MRQLPDAEDEQASGKREVRKFGEEDVRKGSAAGGRAENKQSLADQRVRPARGMRKARLSHGAARRPDPFRRGHNQVRPCLALAREDG